MDHLHEIMCLTRRQRESSDTEEEAATWPRSKDCSDAAMSQGTPAANRSWKRPETDSPLEPREGGQRSPANTLISAQRN